MPKIVLLFFDYALRFLGAWDMPGTLFGGFAKTEQGACRKQKEPHDRGPPSFVGIFVCILLSLLFLSWKFHAVFLAKVLKSDFAIFGRPSSISFKADFGRFFYVV